MLWKFLFKPTRGFQPPTLRQRTLSLPPTKARFFIHSLPIYAHWRKLNNTICFHQPRPQPSSRHRFPADSSRTTDRQISCQLIVDVLSIRRQCIVNFPSIYILAACNSKNPIATITRHQFTVQSHSICDDNVPSTC